MYYTTYKIAATFLYKKAAASGANPRVIYCALSSIYHPSSWRSPGPKADKLRHSRYFRDESDAKQFPSIPRLQSNFVNILISRAIADICRVFHGVIVLENKINELVSQVNLGRGHGNSEVIKPDIVSSRWHVHSECDFAACFLGKKS